MMSNSRRELLLGRFLKFKLLFSWDGESSHDVDSWVPLSGEWWFSDHARIPLFIKAVAGDVRRWFESNGRAVKIKTRLINQTEPVRQKTLTQFLGIIRKGE